MNRAQVKQALDQVPMVEVLGMKVASTLTTKQKAFAKNLALGDTGATAYRKAYNSKTTRAATVGNDASTLKARPDIAREVEAYRLAIEAGKQRTPAALRDLVIQTLVQVMIDPDTPPAVRIGAAKIAGQITEVAAFTERKEVRTISSSEDARARIMAELKRLSNNDADDAVIVNAADSLLAELAPNAGNVSTPARLMGDDLPAGNVSTDDDLPADDAGLPDDGRW